MRDDINTDKGKRNPTERIFIVKEVYAGKKKFSEVFADLIYAAYCEREPDASGDRFNRIGYSPDQTGHDNYAEV
jgi:hypothetical protein